MTFQAEGDIVTPFTSVRIYAIWMQRPHERVSCMHARFAYSKASKAGEDMHARFAYSKAGEELAMRFEELAIVHAVV